VAVGNCLALPGQELCFMEQAGHSVHLNQILYVLLVVEPFERKLEFAIFLGAVPYVAPSTAELEAATQVQQDEVESADEVASAQVTPAVDVLLQGTSRVVIVVRSRLGALQLA